MSYSVKDIENIITSQGKIIITITNNDNNNRNRSLITVINSLSFLYLFRCLRKSRRLRLNLSLLCEQVWVFLRRMRHLTKRFTWKVLRVKQNPLSLLLSVLYVLFVTSQLEMLVIGMELGSDGNQTNNQQSDMNVDTSK